MEQDITGEYPPPGVPRCYSWSPAKLQGAHTQYKDEGGHPHTIRTTALSLGYYVAEYAAPVWARSSHAQKLNPGLKSACRAVTGCLKPTNVEYLYLLSGIAPPNIRRDVCARMEKTKQETNEAHSVYGQNPAERWLKSRNCFLRSVKLLTSLLGWFDVVHGLGDYKQYLDESLSKGFGRPWATWRCLNRLRTGFTCSKEQRQRWRYYEGDTTCERGLATKNTAHMMQCTLIEQPCSLDDFNKFNDTAKKCVERWKTLVWLHDDDDDSTLFWWTTLLDGELQH